MFSLSNLSAVFLPTAHMRCDSIETAVPQRVHPPQYSTPFTLVKASQSYQLKWTSARSSCSQLDGSLISIVGHEMTSALMASVSASHLTALFGGPRDDDAMSE